MAAAKRGRPKGSKNKRKASNWGAWGAPGGAFAGYASMKPKRGRGRPAGSKNKNLGKLIQSGWAAQPGNLPKGAWGIGNPALVAAMSGVVTPMKPKRGRGRPKGSKNKVIYQSGKNLSLSGPWAKVSKSQLKVSKERNEIPLSVLLANAQKLANTINQRVARNR